MERSAYPEIFLDALSLTFGGKTVLNNMTLKLEPSSRTALLGASGSGKTSILRTIAGFVSPSSGNVFLSGLNVRKVPPEERNIAMLFQYPVLFPRLTVRENARAAMGGRGGKNAVESRIRALAADFRIDDKLDRRVDSDLSGGELQRAALLRVFANERSILLLDEPLKGALNVDLRWSLLSAIRKHIKNTANTTIIVTHDFSEASYLADRLVVLHESGYQEGTPQEIYSSPDSVQLGRLLGAGNSIPAYLLAGVMLRDGTFPLSINGPCPAVLGDTDNLFIRPEKLTVRPSTVGFRVLEDRFLGNARRLQLQAPNGTVIEADVTPAHELSDTVGVSVESSDIVVCDPQGNRRRI